MLLLWHILVDTFASIGVLTVLVILVARWGMRRPYPPLQMSFDDYRDSIL